MSRFFRSGSDDSSSDDDSSDEEEVSVAESPSVSNRRLLNGNAIATGGARPSLALAQPPLNSSHRDVLLHTLLEDRCINEVRSEQEWARRSSADIREEIQARYQRLCAQLAPINLVSSGLEQEAHAGTRQAYRDGLNMLSGRGRPSIRQQSVVKAVTKLLAESVSSSSLGQLPEEAGPITLFRPPRSSTIPDSQYLRDFEELGFLGKGGYGSVYHVRHRLDSHAYAVKKVRIASSNLAQVNSTQKSHEVEEVLKELRTLAKLEHPNVVRYYSSWVELTTPSADDSRNAPSNDATGFTEDLSESNSLHRVTTTTDSNHDSGNFITFAEPSGTMLDTSKSSHGSHLNNNSEEASYRNVRADTGLAIAFDAADHCGFSPTAVSESGFTTSGFGRLQSSLEPCLALHIQMALYPMTLADFLTPGLTPNVSKLPPSQVPPLTHCFHLEPSIRIMLALLDGVDYIHSRGIIHRDLKPANIFLRVEDEQTASPVSSTSSRQGSIDLGLCAPCQTHTTSSSSTAKDASKIGSNICICIGDFGLVSNITTPTSPPLSSLTSVMSPPMSPTNTSNNRVATQPMTPPRPPAVRVGTELYRPLDDPAPDAHPPPVGPSTDLFALGIIAFELLYPFSTQMERRTTLMNLRQGKFPDGFPELAREVIGEMLGFPSTMEKQNTGQDGAGRAEGGCTVEGLRKRLAGLLVEEKVDHGVRQRSNKFSSVSW
jgi:translation initiation factor 2-alpha kinase 3